MALRELIRTDVPRCSFFFLFLSLSYSFLSFSFLFLMEAVVRLARTVFSPENVQECDYFQTGKKTNESFFGRDCYAGLEGKKLVYIQNI